MLREEYKYCNGQELMKVVGGSVKNYIRQLGPDGGNGGSEGRLLAFADSLSRFR